MSPNYSPNYSGTSSPSPEKNLGVKKTTSSDNLNRKRERPIVHNRTKSAPENRDEQLALENYSFGAGTSNNLSLLINDALSEKLKENEKINVVLKANDLSNEEYSLLFLPLIQRLIANGWTDDNDESFQGINLRWSEIFKNSIKSNEERTLSLEKEFEDFSKEIKGKLKFIQEDSENALLNSFSSSSTLRYNFVVIANKLNESWQEHEEDFYRTKLLAAQQRNLTNEKIDSLSKAFQLSTERIERRLTFLEETFKKKQEIYNLQTQEISSLKFWNGRLFLITFIIAFFSLVTSLFSFLIFFKKIDDKKEEASLLNVKITR